MTLYPGSRFTLLSVRISELAEAANVPTSTVRYYERIGLMPAPARTTSGYRLYDADATDRLVFITRAKRIGLTLEQIAELLPIWDGVNCAATHSEMTRLVELKRADVAERIAELERFAAQLDEVRAALDDGPPPNACLPDLACCMPETDGARVAFIQQPTSLRKPW